MSVCGRDRVRARVRVVDHAELEPGVLDLVVDPQLLARVHLVAQRAGGRVARAVDGDRLAVARGDHAAALVGRVGASVLDDLVEELSGDAQGYLAPVEGRGDVVVVVVVAVCRR